MGVVSILRQQKEEYVEMMSTMFAIFLLGKSTCISLFLRYYEPSSGQITIDGRPITDYNVQKLRENIGVVSQEPVCILFTFDSRFTTFI